MSKSLRPLRSAIAMLAALALLSGSALAEDKQPKPGSKGGPTSSQVESGVVNINTANAAELGRLPGIGPAKADAIIALRTKVKRFSRIEQLMRVRGIGRKTFRKLRPMLTVSGPTTLGGTGARASSPAAGSKSAPHKR